MTNNQINDNLIEVIPLSLTIFDLWSHFYLSVVGWMDILTFLTFCLNHLSPLQGYFFEVLYPFLVIGGLRASKIHH